MAEYFYKLCSILMGLQWASNYKQKQSKQKGSLQQFLYKT